MASRTLSTRGGQISHSIKMTSQGFKEVPFVAGRADHRHGPQSPSFPVGLHPEHHQRGPLGGSDVTQVINVTVCHDFLLGGFNREGKWIKSSLTFVGSIMYVNKLRDSQLFEPSAAVRGATRWLCFAMRMIHQSHDSHQLFSERLPQGFFLPQNQTGRGNKPDRASPHASQQ